MSSFKEAFAKKDTRAMKKKAVSKIAKGKRARAVVFHGNKEKTYTGLTKGDLMMNSRGKIVSKKASAAAKKRYATGLKGWISAVQKARKALGTKGFVPIKKGSPLYNKAKEFYN